MNIREITDKDKNFIFSSWLKSYRNAQAVKPVVNTLYYKEQHRVIEELLERSKVLVLHSPDDENNLIGYVVVEEIQGIPVIHWLYVKHTFRGMGLARILLLHIGVAAETTCCFTHMSAAANGVSKKFPAAYYNPYLTR